MIRIPLCALLMTVSGVQASDLGVILDNLTDKQQETISALSDHELTFVTGSLSGIGIPVRRSWSNLNSGDMFATTAAFRVNQVVDGDSVIGYSNSVWIDGIPTSNLSDDDRVSFGKRVFVCTGNKQYTTVLGGTKTVMRVEVFNTDASLKVIKPIAEAHGFRVWGEGSGVYVVAKYKTKSGSRVVLTTPQGKSLRIKETDFTDADLEWIEKYREQKRNGEL